MPSRNVRIWYHPSWLPSWIFLSKSNGFSDILKIPNLNLIKPSYRFSTNFRSFISFYLLKMQISWSEDKYNCLYMAYFKLLETSLISTNMLLFGVWLVHSSNLRGVSVTLGATKQERNYSLMQVLSQVHYNLSEKCMNCTKNKHRKWTAVGIGASSVLSVNFKKHETFDGHRVLTQLFWVLGTVYYLLSNEDIN